MLKIRSNLQIGDAISQAIEWPRNEAIEALVNGLLERDMDLALSFDEEINAAISRAAYAGFMAGFAAGRHPERLLFSE